MSNEQCVHHWVVDELNVGRCKNCPAVKDFDALMNEDKKVAQILHSAHRRRRGEHRAQGQIKFGRAPGKPRLGFHFPQLFSRPVRLPWL